MLLDSVDLSSKISGQEYDAKLTELQMSLLNYQYRMIEEKTPVILMFEGWDASGKGGAIKRLTEKMDPRTYRVHPIGPPSVTEMQYHYLRRFWDRLPRHGEMAIFDRSWYGRVMVERVEKLCKKHEWKRAYQEINDFEQLLVDDGTLLIKFFIHISKDEQLRRFKDRENSPWKRWKITKDDYRNREKWDDYEIAIREMLEKTHTAHAPWTVVPGDNKRFGRIRVLETINNRFKRFFDNN